LMSWVTSLAYTRGLKEKVWDVSRKGADASAATWREEGKDGIGLDLDLDQQWCRLL
jgi:hypothetical protein